MALTLPLQARAPAKLNLCLYVGPRRPNGLHEICSIFQPVSLADRITIEAEERDEVVCPGVSEPNLAFKALERFRAEFGLDEPGLRVTIDKQIPLAAGLGGGSADAAAVLRLCAGLRGLDPHELTGIAMALGADVPSQLAPRTALVTGAGERVEPAAGLDRLACVLLHGVGKLPTALVYTQADELGATRKSLDREIQLVRKSLEGAAGNSLALDKIATNDLQSVAARLEPTVDRGLELLREQDVRVALMSGSGPAVFGIFAGRAEAEQAAAGLTGRWDGVVSVVEAVASDYAATASFSGSGQ